MPCTPGPRQRLPCSPNLSPPAPLHRTITPQIMPQSSQSHLHTLSSTLLGSLHEVKLPLSPPGRSWEGQTLLAGQTGHVVWPHLCAQSSPAVLPSVGSLSSLPGEPSQAPPLPLRSGSHGPRACWARHWTLSSGPPWAWLPALKPSGVSPGGGSEGLASGILLVSRRLAFPAKPGERVSRLCVSAWRASLAWRGPLSTHPLPAPTSAGPCPAQPPPASLGLPALRASSSLWLPPSGHSGVAGFLKAAGLPGGPTCSQLLLPSTFSLPCSSVT